MVSKKSSAVLSGAPSVSFTVSSCEASGLSKQVSELSEELSRMRGYYCWLSAQHE
jgi:hypothetical protein